MAEFVPTVQSVRIAYTYVDDEQPRHITDARMDAFNRWLAEYRRQVIEECAQVALGPSASGILHDAATARDIAVAIRAHGEAVDA